MHIKILGDSVYVVSIFDIVSFNKWGSDIIMYNAKGPARGFEFIWADGEWRAYDGYKRGLARGSQTLKDLMAMEEAAKTSFFLISDMHAITDDMSAAPPAAATASSGPKTWAVRTGTRRAKKSRSKTRSRSHSAGGFGP